MTRRGLIPEGGVEEEFYYHHPSLPSSLPCSQHAKCKETKELLKLVFLSFAPFPPPLMKRWNESFSLYGEGGLLSSKIPSTAMNITQTPQEQR